MHYNFFKKILFFMSQMYFKTRFAYPVVVSYFFFFISFIICLRGSVFLVYYSKSLLASIFVSLYLVVFNICWSVQRARLIWL